MTPSPTRGRGPAPPPESLAIETYISRQRPSLSTNPDFYVSADSTISPSTPIYLQQQRFLLKRSSDACKTFCRYACSCERTLVLGIRIGPASGCRHDGHSNSSFLNGISLIVLMALLYLCERIVSLPTQKCGGRQSVARSLHSANRCHLCSQLTDESSAPSHPLYPHSTYSRA